MDRGSDPVKTDREREDEEMLLGESEDRPLGSEASRTVAEHTPEHLRRARTDIEPLLEH